MNNVTIESSWIGRLILAALFMCLAMVPVAEGFGQRYPGQEESQEGKLFTSIGSEYTLKSFKEIRVNVNLENAPLSQVFQFLERESGLKFLYHKNKIEGSLHRLDLDFSQATLAEVLEQVGQQTGLGFRQINRIVSVNVNHLREVELEAVPEEEYQQVVTGRVTDAQTGEALPGVNIVVDGTTTGTSTAADGTYELSVPSLSATLRFSFIGYQALNEPINGRSQVNVALQAVAITGEDVVVTALGIDREARALGYSASRVSPREVTVNRTPNFINALQGKIAGVSVSQMGSGPQGSSKVRIRGQSSFGGNNSPLIVVDGIPIDNSTFGVSGDVSERGRHRNSDSGDGWSSINPDNIVDMTVLKGAAAAALYGSRAKDGVIMITTRNRAEGSGIQVELNSNMTMERPIDRRDYQMEYGQGEGGVRPTQPFPVSGQWSFGEKFEPGMTHILFDGVEVPYEPQRNQLREYYRNGTNMNNTLTVSQGGANGGFSLSFSNMYSESILPGSDYTRNTIGVGFTHNLTNLVTITGNLNYSNEDRVNPPNIAEQDYSPVSIYNMANSMPMSLLKQYAFDEEGNEVAWSRFTNRTNPYFALSRFENNVRDRVFGNITARINLTDWLYLQGRIGQDYYVRNQEYNLPTGSQQQPPAPAGFFNGEYVRDNMNFRELNLDFLLGMNRTYRNFGIDVFVGGSQMYQHRERDNVLVLDFFSRGLYSVQNGRSLSPNHSFSERQVNSLYGSAEFSWLGLVYVTGTLRNDWFSTLSPEERSILYPSVTTSFIFSDAFSVPEWLTLGKIRASYAEVGSDTDVPPYSNNLFYSINNNFFNGAALGSISGATVPNPNLRPMRVSEWELGLELTLFDNLSVELAWYDKTSSDQILSQQIPNSSGFSSRRINVAEAKNQGVEMLLDFSPIRTQNFFWNFNFNAAYNTTKVIDLGSEYGIDEITVGNADFHGELRQVVGKPMNQLYGWGWLRDEQGRRVFDKNTGIPMRSTEQLSFGSSIPNWIGGISNSFNYKGVTLSMLVDFKLGHKMISGTHTNAYRHGLDKATLPGRAEGFVIGEGVNPDGSVNTTPAPVQSYYEAVRAHMISEESVFNAGSWQLRQITLGYDFAPLLPGLGVRALRLSAVANNVAVLKSWVPHIHPDQNGIISDQRQGLEATGLPVTTGIGFNLNVQI